MKPWSQHYESIGPFLRLCEFSCRLTGHILLGGLFLNCHLSEVKRLCWYFAHWWESYYVVPVVSLRSKAIGNQFCSHGSLNNHLFRRIWLAVEKFQPIRKWLKELSWRAKPRVPSERALKTVSETGVISDPATTLQSMLNAKLSWYGFWHCHENRLIKTFQTIPHNLYLSFKSASLYWGLG